MPSRLFPTEHWQIAQRIAEIVYCNVFDHRRWELEKECLGSEYKEGERYVAPGESEELLAPNVRKLVQLSQSILDKARERLVANPLGFTDKEMQVYERVSHFLVYHLHQEKFDGLLHRSLSGRKSNESVDFYIDCREAMRRYLSVSEKLRLSLEDEAKYFAFYFQVRRAWLVTYKYLVGGSQPMIKLRARIWQSTFTRDMYRYQRSLYDRMGDIVTLVTGPSGSGKELVARAVGFARFIPFDHRTSSFAADFQEAFYPVNLSALSPTLIESELFGHRKGAFTGALQDKRGYFEDCGEFGTVFLDEIGETDTAIQVKLLRVLQTRQYQRLGDTKLLPFMGKVTAATNRDLAQGRREGWFREDFYYRLCADNIVTPSLRDLLDDSKDELERMVHYIARNVVGEDDSSLLAEESCEWIHKRLGPGYRWPGNFRELEQCIRNIMIQGSYVPDGGAGEKEQAITVKAKQSRFTANQLMSEYAQSLYRENGSYEETAKIMQVDRRTAKRYVMGVD